MRKLKLKNFNWYGVSHPAVKKSFGSQLKYIGTFCIKGEYTPRVFYFNPTPDRAKNHKDYMTIQTDTDGTFIGGIDTVDLEPFRYQDGLQCPECLDVIYSVTRHDYRECKCKKNFIDGGRDYTRSTKGISLTIDLIKGTWKLLTKEST